MSGWRRVGADVFQEGRGGHEEQIAGLRDAEIEQTVVIAGGTADEHVLQHLLDRSGRTCIADEIGAELLLGNIPEWHVVAEDLHFLAVLDDGRQRAMSEARLGGIVELDVGKLGAADDALLRLGGQRIPTGQIVQIFLYDDIAAAREEGVFIADISGIDRRLRRRILRAVDEAEKVAVVEIAKPMYLVDCCNRVAERNHDLRRQLETEVHALGADMEQQIPRCCDRLPRAGLDLSKRMQLCRPRIAEDPVPRLGADPHDAGEVSLDIAEADRAQQRREVAAKRPDGRTARLARVDRYDKKDRGPGKGLNDRLRRGRQARLCTGFGQGISLRR